MIARGLSAQLGPAGRDSLGLRGGRLAFSARQYDLLLDLDASREWFPEGRSAVEWRLITARALRNTGRADSMAARYAWVERHGEAADRATACWEWAREMEFLRRFAEADSLYGRMLAIGAGELRAQAMLRRGICRYGAGDWSGARSRLEAAAAAGTDEDRAFAWFWIYRAELAAGRSDRATAALAEAARGRAGYYGRRAGSALELASQPGGPSPLDPQAYWNAVVALGREPALSEVAAAGSSGGNRGGGSVAGARAAWARDRLLLFRLCGRSDWAGEVKETLESSAGFAAGASAAESWGQLGLPDLAARAAVRAGGRLAQRFPRPFPGEVAAAARRFRLAPEWIWAVMRRESFFESAVVSSAGATGLLQLMEGTARETAERHGLAPAPLRSPRVNIELGSAHLHDLLAEEPDQWPVVLAAYNAGLPPARRWRAPGEDPDVYIEMIGYRETREYVRRVLEGFWVYRGLRRGE